MDDFYKKIKALSDCKKNNDDVRKHVVDIHIKEAIAITTYDHKARMYLSAVRGGTEAFLFIFDDEYKMPNGVFLHDLIFPNDRYVEFIQKNCITSFVERLQEMFEVFTIEIRELSPGVYAIIAKWDKSNDESDENQQDEEQYDEY